MKCLHCSVEIFATEDRHYLHDDVDGGWACHTFRCPSCQRCAIFLVNGETKVTQQSGYYISPKKIVRLVNPRGSSRSPCPLEVPEKVRADYLEACIVLPDSLKASAALGRRCLQLLLTDRGHTKTENLAKQIDDAIAADRLPADLADSLNMVREIGNFAAHPRKSTSTGEIMDVEPGEAEWTLDVLEELFDFYYVQPAARKAKKDALNARLRDAGKKEI